MVKTKVPPPVVTLVFGLIMYSLDAWAPMSVALSNNAQLLLASICGLLLVLSAVVLIPALISFIRHKTTVNPLKPEQASTLVVSGVYRFSRNPMYLAMASTLLAWGLWLFNPLNIAVLALYVWCMNRFQIIPEEEALKAKFGDQFKTYCQKVRRWI